MINSDNYFAQVNCIRSKNRHSYNSRSTFSHRKENLLTTKNNGGNQVFEAVAVNPIDELLSWSHLRNTALRDERPTGSESQNSHQGRKQSNHTSTPAITSILEKILTGTTRQTCLLVFPSSFSDMFRLKGEQINIVTCNTGQEQGFRKLYYLFLMINCVTMFVTKTEILANSCYSIIKPA